MMFGDMVGVAVLSFIVIALLFTILVSWWPEEPKTQEQPQLQLEQQTTLAEAFLSDNEYDVYRSIS